jgi:hypothetical protein
MKFDNSRNTISISFIFVSILFIYFLLTLFLTDTLPGKGWDGDHYLKIIHSWANGEMGAGSLPYRFIRMGSFLPIVFIDWIFDSDSLTFSFSRILAITVALSSLLFVYLASVSDKNSPQDSKTIKIAAICLCAGLSHAIFTMPSIYPILSDHYAIFLSGASIFIYKKISNDMLVKNIVLILFAAYGFFVMPLASIVPTTFLIFQGRDSFVQSQLVIGLKATVLNLILAFSACLFILAVFRSSIGMMANSYLLSGPSGVSPALISLKQYSYISIFILVVILCFVSSFFLIKSWHLISIKGCVFSVVSFFMALVPLYMIPNWSNGLSGPPLLVNMLSQALHSPLVSFSAFFAYYGPVGIISVIVIFSVAFSKLPMKHADEPIFLCASTLLLPTLIGSETRQFIVILPLLLYISVNYFKFSFSNIFLILVFSIILLSIGFPISESVSQACASGSKFQDPGWQPYFGRQGPWMSVESVVLWQSILISFLLLLFIPNNLMLKVKSNQT